MRARVAAVLLTLAAGAEAAPAHALSRNHMRFFATDSAEPAPRCLLIVEEFAHFWHALRNGEADCRPYPSPPGTPPQPCPAETARVEVEGHTDGDEAARGHAAVSRARIEAVVALLRQNGVPAEVVVPRDSGGARPLAPLPPGGAEPQNRHVEIFAR